jgi:hypothetical protein
MGVTTSNDSSRVTGRVVAVGLAGAVIGTVLTLALAGVGDDRVSAPEGAPVQEPIQQVTLPPISTSTEVPATAAPAEQVTVTPQVADNPAAPVSLPPAAPVAGRLTAEQAGQIAAALVGGTVDTVHAENEYGAAWDVDVYAPDGEYTIYVSSTGEVMRVDGPFRD